MTTFVLQGGQTSTVNHKTRAFFRQFSQLGTQSQLHYLMCYWARPENEWQKRFAHDEKHICNQTDKSMTFTVVKNPDELRQKLPLANGLYIAGGEAQPLEKYYPDLGDLLNLIDGKIYLGSSMGAFMAAKSYVLSPDSDDETTIHHGLDLLPINILCHWDLEQKKAMKLQLLQAVKPEIPTIVLDEYEWITLYR